MDKRSLQTYSVWAKGNLEMQIEVSLKTLGINGDRDIKSAKTIGDYTIIDGDPNSYPADLFGKRAQIISMVAQNGFRNVIEEFAYTWFNRLVALRFMEVHDYLPHGFRVLSNRSGGVEPEILKNLSFVKVELGLDMVYCASLKEQGKLEELYRYVLLHQCSALSNILPRLFTREKDFLELLLPKSLLIGETVITRLIEIPEDNFRNDVQIIGWLYQYYNTEKKAEVFAALKRNVKITRENIPAATQLFTPDWIVRYMVENSLGRLWIEGHPDDELKSSWKYYLDEADQEPEVQNQLAEIRKECAALSPEDIRVIDPCCGSGHILVYMFDVLVQIYESRGHSRQDAAQNIVRYNLHGLDIDARAAQLAYFAVMMKAREYDRRFFSRGIQPRVYSTACFEEGKEYGSLLITDDPGDVPDEGQLSLHDDEQKVRHILTQQYHVVCTNPPYMAVSNVNGKMQEYVKKSYSDSKADLFSAFMEKAYHLAKINGFTSFITMESWMFLSSFEKLRRKINLSKTIINMVHMPYLGKGGTSMGINFGTAAVVMRNCRIKNYSAQYEYTIYYETDEDGIPFIFPTINERWKTAKQENFSKIPGSPVAYWVGEATLDAFSETSICTIAEPRMGLTTGNNDYYLRLWYEVVKKSIGFGHSRESSQLSGLKWFPYNKGGEYRKWFGNQEYIVNWLNDGFEMQTKLHPDGSRIWAHNFNLEYNFKKHICWNDLTTRAVSFRAFDNGFLFDSCAAVAFVPKDHYLFALGYLNTNFVSELSKLLNPTLHFKLGDFLKLPYVVAQKEQVEHIVKTNIALSKEDWDSFETSWDFQRHPLVRRATAVAEAYAAWERECAKRFNQLKTNEEELNRIFIDIYGLQNELTPEVEDRDVTIRLADKERDIRSLISYLVGIVMGRYSLDVDGLAYAGGEWDASKYVTWQPDDDGIVPIYRVIGMEDGLTTRITQLIKLIYGEETYRQNMDFIAEALGKNNNESSEETLNRYLNDGFYADHLRIYQKRPIYWMFSSGKHSGFKCLIYMHRYNSDTLARINGRYFLPESTRLKNDLEELLIRISRAEGRDKIRLEKERQKLTAAYHEAIEYGQVLDHMANKYIAIDLDDGVKVNYAKFQAVELITDSGTKVTKDLLVPIK